MTLALPRWSLAASLLLLGVATCAAVLAGGGHPAVGAAPVLAVVAAAAVWSLPLRRTLTALLFAVLVIDNPQERPAAGLWQSPLYPVGSLLFENLSKLTGVDALRFALVDLLVLALAALAVLRGASGPAEPARAPATRAARAGPPRARLLKFFTASLLLALAGMALAMAWGTLRGGDPKASLWQVRQLVATPILALLFVSSFRAPEDLAALGRVVVAAAVLRTAEALYFYEVICRPRNFRPPYATSHADTLLFCLALMLLAIHWHEARTRRSFWALVLGGAWIMGGVYMNGRRLAYVSLAASALAVFLLTPRTALKRAVLRLAVLCLPIAALYLAAGWDSTAKVFRPAQLAKSVLVASSSRSTQTRDIENYNLATTLKQSPLLGIGFGHEYREFSRADDITRLFPQYRLIPHNSLLGLWAFTGLVGVYLVLLPLVVGVYLAVRAYGRAPTPRLRTLALSTVVMAIAWLLQAWGDMGLQCWGAAFLLAATLAASARLSAAVDVDLDVDPARGGTP